LNFLAANAEAAGHPFPTLPYAVHIAADLINQILSPPSLPLQAQLSQAPLSWVAQS
jgi:hypothetical protein